MNKILSKKFMKRDVKMAEKERVKFESYSWSESRRFRPRPGVGRMVTLHESVQNHLPFGLFCSPTQLKRELAIKSVYHKYKPWNYRKYINLVEKDKSKSIFPDHV